MEDKVNKPYTQAVITETLRMANTVPLGLPHATSCDFHFRGYVIPKGTTITPALSSFTADPGMFPEPEVFNPSRFIDEKGKLMGQEKVLTFSLGENLHLFIFLSYIAIQVLEMLTLRTKMKRSDSALCEKPLHPQQNLKKATCQHKTPPKIQLHNDCEPTYVETILSWTCHVYGPFEFRTSLDTSILLRTVSWSNDSHPTSVVKPVNRILSFQLTA